MKKGGDGKGGPGRPEDEKLWDFVIRTVTPLAGKGLIGKEPPRVAGPKHTPEESPLRDWSPDFGLKPSVPHVATAPGNSTDRRTAQRLRRGEIAVERVLDLHGLRQGEAQEHLFRFLQQAAQFGCRCVLVITGKGRDGDGGVLRRALPLWLGLPAVAGLILDYTPARPRDGGAGAFYILLRRQR